MTLFKITLTSYLIYCVLDDIQEIQISIPIGK